MSCELDSTLALLAFDPVSGAFESRDTLAAVPAQAREGNHCSDVKIHPGGRFAYAADRGHVSILVLGVDADRERLIQVGHQGCGGRSPAIWRSTRPASSSW